MNRFCSWMRTSVVRASWAGIALAGLIMIPARAAMAQAPSCIIDQQGVDDEAGQKDLNNLCEPGDHTCASGQTNLSWQFDDVNWSGANTGDACALFDTDSDGFANKAVCVSVWDGAKKLGYCSNNQFEGCKADQDCGRGASCVFDNTPWCYTCGDDRRTRCTNAVAVACAGSLCTVALDTGADPFGPTSRQCSGTNCESDDTQVGCCLVAADNGGTLLDVCSYPSRQPNSDPSDCVLSPDTCSVASDCNDNDACTLDQCIDPPTGANYCQNSPISNDPNFPQCDSGSCVPSECPHDLCSSGTCNPDNSCGETFLPATTTCRASAGPCDTAESCTGTGAACPGDGFLASTTICRPSAGQCDVAESCSGTSGDCPADGFQPATTICRPVAGPCDVADSCMGTEASCPPDAKEPCSFVTNSSLCEFDEYVNVGACDGGSNDGACCMSNADCASNSCVQSKQFRLILTPDVNVWPGYKLSSSNPGQTFYNLIAEDVSPVTITVPYPYVTVGAMPVHVYCAEDLSYDEYGCFVPPTAVAEYPYLITMNDWINGKTTGDVYCEEALGPALVDTTYPKDAGFCTVTVPLPAGLCGGMFYVNMHLDYGLKGVWTDGADADTAPDRYDGMSQSPWGTYDAFVNVASGLTPTVVAINDCTPYTFSDDGSGQEDTVYSVNTFKRIAGVFNQTTASATGTGVSGVKATLKAKATGAVVATATGDTDGYLLLNYKHTGKQATFTVTLDIPGVGLKSKDVVLKANGWAEASYDVSKGTWYIQVVGVK